jgi:hypothetical protein
MRKNLMKGVALLGAAILVAGCSHDAWNQTYDGTQQFAAEYSSNFRTLVLNGQNVDPNQTWNTASTVKLDVSSEIAEGTLKVYASSPVGKSVAPLYEGTIQKGESKSLTLAVPSDAERLYVAVYDAENYMRYEAVNVEGTELSVSFDSSTEEDVSAGRVHRAPGRTFENSHKFTAAPKDEDFATKMPTENIYPANEYYAHNSSTCNYYLNNTEYQELNPWVGKAYYYIDGNHNIKFNNPGDGNDNVRFYILPGANVHFTESFNYQKADNFAMYVSEGAKVTFDKDMSANVVMYNRGEVVINGVAGPYANGVIYNQGTITCKNGLHVFNNNAEVVNEGTLNVTAGDVTVEGSGHMWNAAGGQMTVKNETLVNSNNCTWINDGHYHTGQYKYTAGSWNVINNCKLVVDKEFYITLGDGQGEFKLDGSIECNTFYHGTGITRMAGKSVIKVAGTLTCHADADGRYYGFYGPDTNANGYSVIQAKKITAYSLTQRRAITYRGYLIVATDNHWDQCDRNDGNYPLWDQGANVKMSLKNKDDITETIEPTDCNAGIKGKGIIEIAEPKQYVYFAFEDLGTSDDFDFNDVVVRVSVPDANNQSTVELCAIGGTLEQKVFLDDTQLGEEVHHYGDFGANVKTMVGMPITTLATITVPNGVAVADLNIKIRVLRKDGEKVTVPGPQPGEIPFRVTVMGNEKGKWFWPKERTNISDAYTQFGLWGANMDSNPDWYKNPASKKVINW